MTSARSVSHASSFVLQIDRCWRAPRRRKWERTTPPGAERALAALQDAFAKLRNADRPDPDEALASTRAAIDAWLSFGPLPVSQRFALPYVAAELAQRLCNVGAARWLAGDMARARRLFEEELPIRRWVLHVTPCAHASARLVDCLRNLAVCCLRPALLDAGPYLSEALGRMGRRPRPLSPRDATRTAELLGLAAELACASGETARGRAFALDAAGFLCGLFGAGETANLLGTVYQLGRVALYQDDQDWDALAAKLYDVAMPAARAFLAEHSDNLRWRRRICGMAGDASEALFCCARAKEARALSAEELSLARSCVALSVGAAEDRERLADALKWAARLAEEAGDAALAGDLKHAAAREETAAAAAG